MTDDRILEALKPPTAREWQVAEAMARAAYSPHLFQSDGEPRIVPHPDHIRAATKEDAWRYLVEAFVQDARALLKKLDSDG